MSALLGGCAVLATFVGAVIAFIAGALHEQGQEETGARGFVISLGLFAAALVSAFFAGAM